MLCQVLHNIKHFQHHFRYVSVPQLFLFLLIHHLYYCLLIDIVTPETEQFTKITEFYEKCDCPIVVLVAKTNNVAIKEELDAEAEKKITKDMFRTRKNFDDETFPEYITRYYIFFFIHSRY